MTRTRSSFWAHVHACQTTELHSQSLYAYVCLCIDPHYVLLPRLYTCTALLHIRTCHAPCPEQSGQMVRTVLYGRIGVVEFKGRSRHPPAMILYVSPVCGQVAIRPLMDRPPPSHTATRTFTPAAQHKPCVGLCLGFFSCVVSLGCVGL